MKILYKTDDGDDISLAVHLFKFFYKTIKYTSIHSSIQWLMCECFLPKNISNYNWGQACLLHFNSWIWTILKFLKCACVCMTHQHWNSDSLPVGDGCRQRTVKLQEWTAEITNHQLIKWADNGRESVKKRRKIMIIALLELWSCVREWWYLFGGSVGMQRFYFV